MSKTFFLLSISIIIDAKFLDRLIKIETLLIEWSLMIDRLIITTGDCLQLHHIVVLNNIVMFLSWSSVMLILWQSAMYLLDIVSNVLSNNAWYSLYDNASYSLLESILLFFDIVWNFLCDNPLYSPSDNITNSKCINISYSLLEMHHSLSVTYKYHSDEVSEFLCV